jgi:hypothetical protein
LTAGQREWRAIEASEAATCEAELRREMPVGHALHGREVRAVARRDDSDDVAFEVADAGLWIVHLTWQRETNLRWPHAVLVRRLPEHDE